MVFAIIFTLAVPSFASDFVSDTLPISSATLTQFNESADKLHAYDYSSTACCDAVPKGYWGCYFAGYRIYNTNSMFNAANYTKTTLISNNFSVKKNHNYTVSFNYQSSANIKSDVSCYIEVYNGNGSCVQNYNVYSATGMYYDTGYLTANFDFNLSDAQLPSGYSLKFKVDITFSNPAQGSVNTSIFITDISYVDNDDNSGLINQIITAISVVWNSMVDGFENISNSVSSSMSGLGDRISNFFNSLSDNIGGWFSEQKQKIQDFNDNVSQWFTDLGETIKQKFIDLGNDIKSFFTTLKNYLLYFQDPVTVNENGVLVNDSGQPVYTNPFSSAIENVKSQFNSWITSISDFISSIGTTKDSVSSYLNTFKVIIDRFGASVPIFTIVISFGLSFVVIRKVVGR